LPLDITEEHSRRHEEIQTETAALHYIINCVGVAQGAMQPERVCGNSMQNNCCTIFR